MSDDMEPTGAQNMPQEHTPKIKKPTEEELNAAIGHAESRGMYGLLGALLELKQRRAMDRWEAEILG